MSSLLLSLDGKMKVLQILDLRWASCRIATFIPKMIMTCISKELRGSIPSLNIALHTMFGSTPKSSAAAAKIVPAVNSKVKSGLRSGGDRGIINYAAIHQDQEQFHQTNYLPMRVHFHPLPITLNLPRHNIRWFISMGRKRQIHRWFPICRIESVRHGQSLDRLGTNYWAWCSDCYRYLYCCGDIDFIWYHVKCCEFISDTP